MDILETMMEQALETTLSTETQSLEDINAAVEEVIQSRNIEELPENPKSLLVSEATSRFSSAIWYNAIQDSSIVLAGIGGIGSYVALLLARLSPKRISMYDPDTVEMVNMSGQLHSHNRCGDSKINSIQDIIQTIGYYFRAIGHTHRYNSNCNREDIMICGFDNMEARKIFFNNWIRHIFNHPNPEKCLYIDGRLSAESYQIFAIRGDDHRAIEEYKTRWLFDDNEAEETICSYKQTSFMAAMIASTMVNIYVNHMANQCNPIIPRDVPFFTEYTAETMFTKTIM